MNSIVLPRSLINSRTWRGLMPAARAIFLELALADLGDGKPIELSVRDAAYACRCSSGAVTRAFQALIDAGFIVQASGRRRVASKWHLVAAA